VLKLFLQLLKRTNKLHQPFMKLPVFIGIDIGSTVLKVAAVEGKDGKILAHVSYPLRIKVTKDGGREQSALELHRLLFKALSCLRRKTGNAWKYVEGIGLCAQGGSAIIADRITGRPHTPMFMWNDARSRAYSARIVRDYPPLFWRRYTLRDAPGAGLGRILWLKKNRPELMNLKNIYAGAGEYCYFHLTGVWCQDPCNALQIGCYNAVERRLDERLMALSGMPLDFVAPLRIGHEVHPLRTDVAESLGLRDAIPVVGPYMDHESGYLSALCASEKPLQFSLGTAWVGNFRLSRNTKWHSPFQLALPSLIDNGTLVVQPLLTGNVSWNWGLERFISPDINSALKQADAIFTERLLPLPGLVVLPWFNFTNPLGKNFHGGGAYLGMSPATDSSEMVRALAAGLCYEARRIFEEVKNRRKVDSVVLAGGASKGWFFRLLLATLFAPLPVYWSNECDFSGVRGSLFYFNRRFAMMDIKRIKPASDILQRDILKGYEYYYRVFEHVYGKNEYGQRITFL